MSQRVTGWHHGKAPDLAYVVGQNNVTCDLRRLTGEKENFVQNPSNCIFCRFDIILSFIKMMDETLSIGDKPRVVMTMKSSLK